MEPAIIRLSYRYIIDNETTTTNLVTLRESIKSSLSQSGISWKTLHFTHKNFLNKEANEFGNGVLIQLLRKAFPDKESLPEMERNLLLEASKTEIIDYDPLTGNIVLNFFLITEELTLIDHYGDVLVLVRGNQSELLSSGNTLQDVFGIKLDNRCMIVEYKRLILKN